MKVCSKCQAEHPLSNFYKSKGKPIAKCKGCVSAEQKIARTHPARQQADRERGRRWKEQNSDRAAHLMRRGRLKSYGLTPEQFDEMLAAQDGRCAICSRPDSGVRNREGRRPHNLAVDHDHETGQIRGLLCHPCNSSLGKMGDSPDRLRKAADYLEVSS